MDITVRQEQDMPALKRKDYRVRVFHQGPTQSRNALRAALAKTLKADAKLTVVRRINAAFGSAASDVEVSVYKDADALKQFEDAYVIKRHGGEEKAPEAAPEAKPEEEPAPDEPAKEGDA